MLLKSYNTDRAILNNALNFLKKRRRLIGLFLFALYTVLILGVGYILKKNNFYGQVFKPVLSQNYKGIVNYFESFSVDPEKINIDIKAINYYKLAYKRQDAIKKNFLLYTPDEEAWVPATLTHRGKTVKVDIRLKGTGAEHWRDEDAWSFKIKVKGDDTLFGMRRFALQGPGHRSFMQGWYWHKLLRYNGLIALRYDFVDVTVNGKHLSVYVIEENFDKRLLENNNLREGPIFWANLAPFLALKATHFYQSDKYAQKTGFIKMAQIAENLIEGYREGDLPLTKVFDVNKMGKLLALTDLIGDYHTLQYGSPRIGAYHPRAKLMPHHMAVLGRAGTPQSRFYYNPVIGLIEPIAYDNSGIKGEGLVLIGSGRRFAEQGNRKSDWMWPLVLFQDKLLFKKYIESLEEITDKSYLDRFFLETKDEAQERLSLLHRDFPFRKLDMKPIFYKNRERIKKQLQPQKSLNIYFDGVSKGDGILHLDIANIHAFPVEVLGVSLDNINIIKPLKDSIVQARQIVGDDDHWNFMHQPGTRNVIRRGWWDNAKETVLKDVSNLTNLLPMVSTKETKTNQKQPSKNLSGLEYKEIQFQIPGELKWSDNLIPHLRVVSRVFGARFKTYNKITPWARHEDMFVQPDNAKEISFMSVEEESKLIRIKQGEWTVEQDIIIPRGYRVIVGPGTRLDLVNSAKIISYSAVEFIGSKEQPIVIASEGNSGQGMVVIEAKDKSVIRDTIFDRLSSPRQGGWALTGAVTFYESPVMLANVKFINILSEDALNIIRSEFTIENASFQNVLSDALDSDFSNGTIRNASFLDCGNDALDASGSEIHIESIFLNNIGDKGISAGEKSRIFIDNLDGENSRIILASKDQSEVFVQEANIKNSKIGFAAFQKKSEFGPGSIKIKKITMKNIEIPTLIEEGSTLEIDGIPITDRSRDVAKNLY